DAVEDRTTGRAQRVPHGGECGERSLTFVVLEVVDAPGRERLRVGGLVAQAADGRGLGDAGVVVDAGACVRVWCFVDADLQAFAVDVVRQGGDAGGKLGDVPAQVSARVAAVHPAIVDVDVLVSDRLHAGGHEDVGDLLDQHLADVALKRVP